MLSGDPSVSGAILGVVDARRGLREAVAAEPVWTDTCERAAETLTRALLAAGMPRRRILAELRESGLSRSGARQVLRAAREPVEPPDAEGPPAEAQAGSPDERIVCPHCIQPIGRFDHFCPHCGGPVTAHASIDPLGQVYAAGHGYRSATSGRPRFVVLLGMWLIFGPQLAVFLYVLCALCCGPRGDVTAGGILGLAVVFGLGALYAAILWKVTSRYLASR